MKVNKWHRIKQFFRQLFCEHTHTFRIGISKAHRKGRHGQLQLRGCYVCGKIWVVDHRA